MVFGRAPSSTLTTKHKSVLYGCDVVVFWGKQTYGNGGITLRSTGDLSDSDLESAIEAGRAASRGRGGWGDRRGDALRKGDTGSADQGRDDGGGLHVVGGVVDLWWVGEKVRVS